MGRIFLKCTICEIEISRKKSDVRSSRAFCSLRCLAIFNTKPSSEHPCYGCGRTVKRKSKTSSNVFCSRSCAASVNNQRFRKRKKTVKGVCLFCKKEYTGNNRRFCSRPCFLSNLPTTIQQFPRIPFEIKVRKCAECAAHMDRSHRAEASFCSVKCATSNKRKIMDAMAMRQEPCNVYKTQQSLKSFILRHSKHECEICHATEWKGQKIPLVLDHIDGHHHNNNRDNLRLICNNCDSLLPTFKSRNRGNGDPRRRHRYYAKKSSPVYGGSERTRTSKGF